MRFIAQMLSRSVWLAAKFVVALQLGPMLRWAVLLYSASLEPPMQLVGRKVHAARASESAARHEQTRQRRTRLFLTSPYRHGSRLGFKSCRAGCRTCMAVEVA